MTCVGAARRNRLFAPLGGGHDARDGGVGLDGGGRGDAAGQVTQIQTRLRQHLERLGPPPAQAKADHPSQIVSLALDYVTDNAARMDYPRYRREGLPVTSTIVESLIKQFNKRVKGTEKFWLRGGAEAILQGRAAYLSDDGRGAAFYAHRPRGPAVGRNRLRLIA